MITGCLLNSCKRLGVANETSLVTGTRRVTAHEDGFFIEGIDEAGAKITDFASADHPGSMADGGKPFAKIMGGGLCTRWTLCADLQSRALCVLHTLSTRSILSA